MRLASVEVIAYALPFEEPYVTARGRLTRREMVLLRLRDEDGLVGLGEAVPLSLRGGATLEQVVRELEGFGAGPELAARIEGTEPGDDARLGGESGLSAPARCALLTALLDLRGRRASAGGALGSFVTNGETKDPSMAGREPVGPDSEPVVCNATLVAGEPAAVAEEAVRWAEAGFGTFKLKLGAGDDLGQVRAVREALGPGPRIRVDANAAWDVETARRTLAALEPLEIELAEQPVATLEEMAELARATSIPLAGDECVASADDAERAVAAGACRFTGVKLSKVGGPEEALAIADLLPAYVSSALDGPVGIAAAAQVAQTLRATGHPDRLDLAHGLATQRLFASTVASVECELRGDRLHLPPGPGLGVEIDEDALDAHRL